MMIRLIFFNHAPHIQMLLFILWSCLLLIHSFSVLCSQLYPFEVLFQDPISNYFLRVPEELFCKPPESVIVDSNNELVLRSHLLCAAVESPLAMIRRDTSATTTTNPCGLVNDVTLFGGSEIYQSQVDYLSSVKVSGNSSRTTSPLVPGPNGTWVGNPGLYFYRSPTRDVSLRVIDPISFEVIDAHSSCGGALLDTVEYSRAFFCLFEV